MIIYINNKKTPTVVEQMLRKCYRSIKLEFGIIVNVSIV